MKNKIKQQILNLVKENGILRPRDLDPVGIPREYLKRLYFNGYLKKVGRGLYILDNKEIDEYQTIMEACKRVPNGVISLMTALQYHELTTQVPFEVWMAIERTVWLPKVDGTIIRFFRFSGPSFTEGIIKKKVNGVSMKIYNPAKTVADCFKYRNKIGIDVAIEALRDCIQSHKCTFDEIMNYAKICRVANVIKPYMEAMI